MHRWEIASPHMTQLSWQLLSNGYLEIEGLLYTRGQATGQANNCLIDTLRQVCGGGAQVASLAWVRAKLQERFSPAEVARRGLPAGAVVTPGSFLELQHHWADVVDLLFEIDAGKGHTLSSEAFTVKCVDLRYMGNGDVVGSGCHAVHIARVFACHCEPLFLVDMGHR